MPERIRITGKKTERDNFEGYDAQVDKAGNLYVIQGPIQGLNKTYEDASFETGDSPVIHDFYTDTGRYAVGGWIICDGDGDIQVDISTNGVLYGDKFTMKLGESVDLARMDISRIRVTWVSDSSYRILLI